MASPVSSTANSERPARESPDSDWQTHFDQGLELIGQQRYAEALPHLQKAIVAAPDNEVGRCYAARGYAHLCTGNYAQAFDDCSEAIACDPTDGEAYAWRGSAAAGQQQWRAALDDYLEAIRLVPDAAAEYQEIAAAHATRAITQLTHQERRREATAQTYQDRGVAYRVLGHQDLAIRDFSLALKLNPRDAVSLTKRAECYATLGQHERVLADCQAALELVEPTAHLFHLQAVAHRRLDQLDEALAAASRAIDVDPAHTPSYAERGEILFQRGDWQGALHDLSAAITLAPEVARHYVVRGQIFAARGDHATAVCDYSQALRLEPEDQPTLLARGRSLIECDRLDEALADFDAILARDASAADAFVGRGVLQLRLGNPDGAIIEFSKAIRLQPRLVAAYAERAEVFLAQQQFVQALADLSKGIELNPPPKELAPLYYKRGLAYLDVGKPERAVSDFDRALELKPGDADALAWRGSARGHLRAWRSALDDIAAARRSNPAGDEVYRQLGEACAQAALRELDQRLAASPADPQLLLDRAVARDFLGLTLEAVDDYNAALRADQGFVEGYVRRGDLLLRAGRHELAAVDFARAIRLAPQHAQALDGRATALRHLGKHENALAHWNAALEAEQRDARIWRHRGQLLTILGQHEQAARDFARALELDPGNRELHYERGVALMGLGRYQGAVDDFSRVLEAEPKHARALFQRGEAHVHLQRWKRGLADLQAAVEADPSLVPPRSSLGYLLWRMGRHDQAVLELTKGIGRLRYDPAFAVLLATRAKIYAGLGLYRRALVDYTLLIERKPAGLPLAQVYYGRGVAQLHLGEEAKAERSFTKALASDPTFRPAQRALAWLRGDRQQTPRALLPAPQKLPLRKPPVVASAVVVDTAQSAEWQTEPLFDQWIVRTAEGEEFGPCTKRELDGWCGDGRLDATYWLFRIDWDEWLAAGDIYPELALETLRQQNRPVPVALVPTGDTPPDGAVLGDSPSDSGSGSELPVVLGGDAPRREEFPGITF